MESYSATTNRTAKKRTKWPLINHSWNMIDLKTIALFCHLFDLQLSSFFRCTAKFGHAAKKDSIWFLVFRLTFTCLLLLVSFVFSNVGQYNTRMEILFYIAYSIFSGSVGHFVMQKGNNKICCFLISFTHQVKIFFFIYFF